MVNATEGTGWKLDIFRPYHETSMQFSFSTLHNIADNITSECTIISSLESVMVQDFEPVETYYSRVRRSGQRSRIVHRIFCTSIHNDRHRIETHWTHNLSNRGNG